MPVLTRPSAPTHTLPGASFTSLATPTTGSTHTAVWEVRLTPGHPATPHQLTRSEVFVITGGTGVVRLGDDRHDVAAGNVVVVPARTYFAIEAVGDTDLVATCCFPTDGQAVLDDGDPFTPPWAS